MNVQQEDIKNDLMLFIELSCVPKENNQPFEQFHKTLIKISYMATDVCIDYKLKQIHMNVVAEDSKGDFLWRLDNLVPTEVCLTLGYEDLCAFLRKRIMHKKVISKGNYALLQEQFLKGKSLFEKIRPLEKA